MDEESLRELYGHEPVMPGEAMSALNVGEDGFYLDATMGGGGHSRMILKRLGPRGRLLALDLDPDAVNFANDFWGKGETRLLARRGNFGELRALLREEGLGKPDGILADLGLSHRQLKLEERGFSFAGDGPLDMRFDPDNGVSAFEVVNETPEKELADIIFEFGEERRSRKLAREIARARSKAPIRTTRELANLAWRTLSPPKGKTRGGATRGIHPATKLFMALRVKVNDELGNLRAFLADSRECLAEGGVLAVISFHSLEDREVKELFRPKPGHEPALWKPLFEKPLEASEEEKRRNPRSRSAKLRAAVRL
ncbi:MAG: 16S rRNA (cytosine(1402)-N(4))-methyltransferase RsmH [Deltaproteobacteria bacterium]|jgi:16S rRNA (cytosine1402-N4)-methyltransferase|nr:16S rRNA (cytosine(1402)-N(4))-methyltransferase RsmH [Deltaproteobacteria bacterium]